MSIKTIYSEGEKLKGTPVDELTEEQLQLFQDDPNARAGYEGGLLGCMETRRVVEQYRQDVCQHFGEYGEDGALVHLSIYTAGMLLSTIDKLEKQLKLHHGLFDAVDTWQSSFATDPLRDDALVAQFEALNAARVTRALRAMVDRVTL